MLTEQAGILFCEKPQYSQFQQLFFLIIHYNIKSRNETEMIQLAGKQQVET